MTKAAPRTPLQSKVGHGQTADKSDGTSSEASASALGRAGGRLLRLRGGSGDGGLGGDDAGGRRGQGLAGAVAGGGGVLVVGGGDGGRWSPRGGTR